MGRRLAEFQRHGHGTGCFNNKAGMKLLWGGSEPTPTVTGQQPLYAGNSDNEPGQNAPVAQGQGSSHSLVGTPVENGIDEVRPLFSVNLKNAGFVRTLVDAHSIFARFVDAKGIDTIARNQCSLATQGRRIGVLI